MKINWLLYLVLISLISLGLMYWIGYESKVSKAEGVVYIDADTISEVSVIKESTTSATVQLFAKEEPLYTSSSKYLGAVVDFISRNVVVEGESDTKGVNTFDNPSEELFPADFLQNIDLIKAREEPDAFHYTFRQKVESIPIFASAVSFHGKDISEIYGVHGIIVKIPKLVNENVLSESEIHTKIQEKYGSAEISEGKEVWFNAQIIDRSRSDSPLVLSREYIVSDGKKIPSFAFRIVLRVDTGEVVFSEPLIIKALQREIYDCENNPTATECPIRRTEGSSASGIGEVDGLYETVGRTYYYYSNTYGRDSYDRSGGQIVAAANYPTLPNQSNFVCPNAAWYRFPYRFFVVCTGMGTDDIITHEYTHAVSEIEFSPIYQDQMGALDEALADIFAYGNDRNWTMGEGSAIGIVRSISDPARYGNPDRMFSSLYYCGDEDNGGTHINMGVLSKAFSLMVQGGTFNGCNINGIGADVALAIWYRALTNYFLQYDTFRDVYVHVLQACSDIYGSNSGMCTTVDRAFQAVEIDQQDVNDQKGPRCVGKTQRVASCSVAITNTPTLTVTPPSQTPTISSTPTIISTHTPTPIPTGSPSCSQKTSGDANCDGRVNLVDFEMWRREFTGSATTTNANFNPTIDAVVNLVDYEIWRRNYL